MDCLNKLGLEQALSRLPELEPIHWMKVQRTKTNRKVDALSQ